MRTLAELFGGLCLFTLVGYSLSLVIPAWLAALVAMLILICVSDHLAVSEPTQPTEMRQQITTREGPDDWQ